MPASGSACINQFPKLRSFEPARAACRITFAAITPRFCEPLDSAGGRSKIPFSRPEAQARRAKPWSGQVLHVVSAVVAAVMRPCRALNRLIFAPAGPLSNRMGSGPPVVANAIKANGSGLKIVKRDSLELEKISKAYAAHEWMSCVIGRKSVVKAYGHKDPTAQHDLSYESKSNKVRNR